MKKTSKPRVTKKPDARAVALAKGFSSGFEDTITETLTATGVTFTYEEHLIRYEVPARPARYTPDHVLGNNVIIELKGRFVTADRQKHILIKKQCPDLDIRFVFSNSRTRISKQSKTTYAAWCTTHGFQYADKAIPIAWIVEPTKPLSQYIQHVGPKKVANRKATP